MSSSSNSSPDPRLERILAELIEAAESGAPQGAEVWVDRYPEFANEIREFLTGQQQLNQAVQRAAQEVSPMPEPTVLTDVANQESDASASRLISRGALALGSASDQATIQRPRVRYFGDYELLEEIARGGMGVVYKARQVNLKRIVALKMILVGQLANDDDVRRFYAEAEAAAKLEHPNIVPIFEIGLHEGQHYFSMQFIDGESLAHRVSRGVLLPREAAEIMLKVARAIAYAHVEGVIHRDLKPANILLEKAEGRGLRGEAAQTNSSALDPQPSALSPRITDFGLAMRVKDGDAEQTEAARLTATGQVLGTPSYMSPEQAAGRIDEVGRLADVYSLGAVLYCLLTGRPPFQAASPLDTLLQVINAEPVALRLLNPTVPHDLETIALKCLEKEPSRRYAGAAELADDLERFLNDEPIVARPIGRVERLVRLARKHRQTLARTAATVALSLLAVLVGWSSWHSYQESLRGTIELRTSGPQMVAEVIDDNDQPVVPSFPVPTPEKITLPEGSYRVRLSASGLLSDTWPLDVERGQAKTFDVQFRSRLLWPPRELPTDEYLETEIVVLDGDDVARTPASERSERSPKRPERPDISDRATASHASILQVRHPAAGQYGVRTVRMLSLIDGVTGKSAWPNDVTLDEASLPEGRNIQEWVGLLGETGQFEHDRRLVRPLVDLNGDGVRDLMFMSRTTPALVAFSGRDGKLLWWHRARPVLPALPENLDAATLRPTSAPVGTGSVVGQVTLADVNSDGTPDVIACFMTRGESFQAPSGVLIGADAQGWLEAISGKDGSTLWQQKLNDKYESFQTDGSTARQFNGSIRPLVVRSSVAPRQESQTSIGPERGSAPNGLNTSGNPHAEREGDVGGDSVLLIVDRALYGFEIATGKPLASRADLPVAPMAEPMVADLNLDGEDEILMQSMGERMRNSNKESLTLTALTQLGKVLWSKSFSSNKSEYELRRSPHPFFQLEDLDRDNRPEVLVPIGQVGYSSNDRWGGFTVLNGETGETRWQKRVASSRYNDAPQVERFTSGPDLDGDGAREVFVTWRDSDQESQKPVAIVAAMSGRDGSRLWNWKHEVGSSYSSSDSSGPLKWWQPGPDGFPLLLVPIAGGPGGQPMTFILSASTGRLEQTLSEVSDPKVADFNGDAIPDLYYTVSPQGSPRLLVAAGTQAEPWKRLGQWNPIQDVDGDRIGDFISRGGDLVRSGRDQQTLFRIPGPLSEPHRYPALSPPLPFGDLNADGTPDLIGLQEVHRRTEYGSSSRPTLAAFSGKDGQRLWVADKFEMSNGHSSSSGDSWSEEYPAFDWCDLDHDDRAELIVVSIRPKTGHSVQLSMFSGRDGQLLWELPIRRGGFGARPNPYGREFVDLNGDGVGDLALWIPQPTADSYDSPSDLQLFSGRDGKRLWPISNVSTPQGGRPLWPRPAVGDLDGDGQPEVIAAWHKGYDRQQRRHQFQLAAVDGRTGDVKWNHEWSGTNTDILPPLLVNFDGDGQRSICFGTFGPVGHQLTVLGSDGQPRSGSPFTLSKSRRSGGSHAWNKIRLADEDKEALLLVIDDKLCAVGGTGDIVWQWPLDTSPQREYATGGAMLLSSPVAPRQVSQTSIDPESGSTSDTRNTSGNPVAERQGYDKRGDDSTLAIWSGQGVFGLDTATGAMRWHCRVPWSPGSGFSHGPTVELMSSDDHSGTPRVLCHWRTYISDNWHTLARQASPTTPDGRLMSAPPTPRRYIPLPDEKVPQIKLPWAVSHRDPLRNFVESIAFPSGLVTLLVLVIPIWLVRAALRRESIVLSLLLVAYAALCVSPALFGFRQGVTSFVAFGVVIGLMQRAICERAWKPALLALAYSGLLIAPLAVLHFWAFRHPLQRVHAWQNWWWLDELTGEPLMVALAGVPGVAFWWSLVRALRHHDRTTVQRLLIAATLAAAVVAAMMLSVDSRSLTADQHYSPTGWYAIWFWGVPVVGAWLLVRQGVQWLIAWRKSRLARREPQHA